MLACNNAPTQKKAWLLMCIYPQCAPIYSVYSEVSYLMKLHNYVTLHRPIRNMAAVTYRKSENVQG